MKSYSVNALVNTVISTWRYRHLGPVIVKVFDCLEKVVILINEGEGGNDLVETKRGKKHADITFGFTLNASNVKKVNRNVVAIEDNDNVEIPIENVNSDIAHI